jgi:hypothetical protein
MKKQYIRFLTIVFCVYNVHCLYAEGGFFEQRFPYEDTVEYERRLKEEELGRMRVQQRSIMEQYRGSGIQYTYAREKRNIMQICMALIAALLAWLGVKSYRNTRNVE